MEKLLIIEIESIRESMINVALKKGLSAQETIGLSQKLDVLLNQLVVYRDEDYLDNSIEGSFEHMN